MTAPVPYESRVRPLLEAWGIDYRLAAEEMPYRLRSSQPEVNCAVVSDEAGAIHLVAPDVASEDRVVTQLAAVCLNTAAASADLAEAVRAYIGQTTVFGADGNPQWESMLAALARLDAAGGA